MKILLMDVLGDGINYSSFLIGGSNVSRVEYRLSKDRHPNQVSIMSS